MKRPCHAARVLFFGGLVFTARTAASLPLAPDVQSIMTAEGCANPKSQALLGGTLYLSCVMPQGTDQKHYRYYVAQRQTSGAYSTYKLVDYVESSSPRTKVGIKHQVSLSGTSVLHRASTEFGQLNAQTWNLASHPPALISETVGGNHDCREAIEVGGQNYETPNLIAPLCTTDYTQARQVCTREAWACEANALRPEKVRSVSIPLADSVAGADPLACAVTIGKDKAELVSGQNRHGTSFRVSAADNREQKVLRLYLAADDKTPQIAQKSVAGTEGKQDHFQLWLASAPLTARCLETGGRAAYCQERAELKSLRVTLLPTKEQSVSILSPGIPLERLAQVNAVWGPKYLTIELRGEFYTWSKEGALTILYSDSETGNKRDNLLSTANSVADHPETWGQLSVQSLCPRPLIPLSAAVAPAPAH